MIQKAMLYKDWLFILPTSQELSLQGDVLRTQMVQWAPGKSSVVGDRDLYHSKWLEQSPVRSLKSSQWGDWGTEYLDPKDPEAVEHRRCKTARWKGNKYLPPTRLDDIFYISPATGLYATWHYVYTHRRSYYPDYRSIKGVRLAYCRGDSLYFDTSRMNYVEYVNDPYPRIRANMVKASVAEISRLASVSRTETVVKLRVRGGESLGTRYYAPPRHPKPLSDDEIPEFLAFCAYSEALYLDKTQAYNTVDVRFIDLDVDKPSMGFIRRQVTDFHEIYRPYQGDTDHYLTEATCKTVDNAKYVDVNSLALAKDMVKIKEGIDSLLDVLRKDVNPKSISDLFLSTRYGLNLTYKDTSEVIHSVKRAIVDWNHPWSTCRGISAERVASPWPGYSARYNVKLYHEAPESGLLNLIKKSMDWDFWPSLDNMWDMIPYSFVVDWFTNFGDVLSSIDRFAYYQYLNVVSVLESIKTQYEGIPISGGTRDGRTVVGTVKLTTYHRQSRSILRTPTIVSPVIGKDSFSNWLEATALIIQRKH